MRAWMLLLVVVTLGCGEKPGPPASLGPVPEPEPVAGAAKQSPIVPELGQDAIIAEIEKLGGEVGYDEKSPERPIVDVGVYGTEVTDAHVVHLKGLTSLQSLSLYSTQVTDAGLKHLKGLTSLRMLHLEDTQVTDAGLEHLKGLTSLQQLLLRNTQVADAGVNELQKALPNCNVTH